MIKGIIYCATSPSNKKYYGQTLINFDKRVKDHIREAVMYNSEFQICKAIRKYKNEIVWEIIETFEHNDKMQLKLLLNEREIFYIKRDKTNLFEYGYNMTEGGGGGFTGRHHTEESKQKIKNKNTGKFHPMFGKHPSLESIEKNRQSNLGKKQSEETKQRKSISLTGLKHNLKEYSCIYCNVIGKGPNMFRYHMENCKDKYKNQMNFVKIN